MSHVMANLPKALFTLMRFRCHGKRVDPFASTLPFWCVLNCPHVVTQVELYAHATNTRACDILQPTWYIWCHLFHFDALRPFSTVHTNTIWTRFRFGPLSRVFSNWCASDENTQRISVDRRPKRIEMYAFHENALVWTRLKLWASVRWTSISSRFFHKIVGISGEIVAYQELLCEVTQVPSSGATTKTTEKRK